jgi:hypothetical protein
MIPTNIIIALVTAILAILSGGLYNRWNGFSDAQRQSVAEAVGEFVTAVKKEMEPDRKRKILVSAPDDFEGEPELISAWCRRMTMYFQDNGITNSYERMTVALSKVKKGKDGRAQKWADDAIMRMVLFREEYEQTKRIVAEDLITKEFIRDHFTNRPPFEDWETMVTVMEHFFVTGETQANAIEKLQNLKQGGKMIEEFWIEFNTWRHLTGYNEIALVGLF